MYLFHPGLYPTERQVLYGLIGLPIATYVASRVADARGYRSLQRQLKRHFTLTKNALHEGRWWTLYTSTFFHDNLPVLALNTVLIGVAGSRVICWAGLTAFTALTCIGSFLPVAWTLDSHGLDSYHARTGREELRANLGAGMALGRFVALEMLWSNGRQVLRYYSPGKDLLDARGRVIVGCALIWWNWAPIKLWLHRFADHNGVDRRSMADSARIGTYAWVLSLIFSHMF